jgi:hypothetical protein
VLDVQGLIKNIKTECVRLRAHRAHFAWRVTCSLMLGLMMSLTNLLFSIVVFTSVASYHATHLALIHARCLLTSRVGFASLVLACLALNGGANYQFGV